MGFGTFTNKNLIKENINNAENYNTIRKSVNFHIINNDPSTDFMKTIALKMIAAEKQSNRYEAENWPALLYL
jgi:TATA-box binding protein (TBP) (component of TFIID and TFIIIB)